MALLSLTTLAHVRELHGNLVASDTSKDAVIASLILAVSRQIEAELGIGLKLEARTEQYDVEEGQRLFILRALPITSVSSVKASSSRDFSTVTSIADANFYVNLARGTLRFDEDYVIPEGAGVLQVIYTGGFAASAADVITNYPELALACDMQVIHLLTRAPQFGATSKQGGGGSVSYSPPAKLLPEVLELIEPYRRGGR